MKKRLIERGKKEMHFGTKNKAKNQTKLHIALFWREKKIHR